MRTNSIRFNSIVTYNKSTAVITGCCNTQIDTTGSTQIDIGINSYIGWAGNSGGDIIGNTYRETTISRCSRSIFDFERICGNTNREQ